MLPPHASVRERHMSGRGVLFEAPIRCIGTVCRRSSKHMHLARRTARQYCGHAFVCSSLWSDYGRDEFLVLCQRILGVSCR